MESIHQLDKQVRSDQDRMNTDIVGNGTTWMNFDTVFTASEGESYLDKARRMLCDFLLSLLRRYSK